MNVLKGNKGQHFPVELLTQDDIGKLLRACNNGPSGHRNRALIITLYRSGLRISEALKLELRDIDMVNSTLHVRHGKGDKPRFASIDEIAAKYLQLWLAKRSRCRRITGSFVFCTLGGGEMDPRQTRKLFPRLARIAGVEKRVHAHAFRHTHAVELLYERTPLNEISRQLGHESISTTATYLNHISDPELNARIRRREMPVAVAKAMGL